MKTAIVVITEEDKDKVIQFLMKKYDTTFVGIKRPKYEPEIGDIWYVGVNNLLTFAVYKDDYKYVRDKCHIFLGVPSEEKFKTEFDKLDRLNKMEDILSRMCGKLENLALWDKVYNTYYEAKKILRENK